MPTPSGVLLGRELAAQMGFRVGTAGGGVTWQALRMPWAVSLSGVVWVTLPVDLHNRRASADPHSTPMIQQ